MDPLLIKQYGLIEVGPAIVQAADSIKLQNYKTNTPRNFQVQPLHTEDAAALMHALADRIKIDVNRLDFVYFSVCNGAEEHTDLLDPALFESRTFVIPVILPEGGNLIVSKAQGGPDSPFQATFVTLNHIYEFDHEKPHSMHVADNSGCVVIMVAIKKELTHDDSPITGDAGGSPQSEEQRHDHAVADADQCLPEQGN